MVLAELDGTSTTAQFTGLTALERSRKTTAAHAIRTYTKPENLIIDPTCSITATLVESTRA